MKLYTTNHSQYHHLVPLTKRTISLFHGFCTFVIQIRNFCALTRSQFLLMIGDSNRVLIVVEDEVKKNEWRCGSGVGRRLVTSGVEKATSHSFFSEVAFLGQKLCHESWLFWRQLVVFCNESLLTRDDSSLLTFMRFAYLLVGFLTVIWVSWSPSIF